jgi:hypothetical protein
MKRTIVGGAILDNPARGCCLCCRREMPAANLAQHILVREYRPHASVEFDRKYRGEQTRKRKRSKSDE